VLFKNEKGFTLIEVLVAMIILSIVSVGFFSALTNSSKASVSVDIMDTGRAIAESQIEYIKQQSFQYSGIYEANTDVMAEYPGYSVSIPQASAVDQRDTLIQKIVVSVNYGSKVAYNLECLKVKR
jgi:prepilin-type N-terminal cleavage/methylation domain-containing protein